MLKTALSVGTAVTLFAGLAAAQTPLPGQPVPPAQPYTPQPAGTSPGVAPGNPGQPQGSGQVYRVKSVLGSRVSLQGGLAVGTVDDIVFDDAGQVEYLIVLNEGRYVSVPWQASQFNFEQRTFSVNITPQQFRAVPTFTTTTYPTFTAPAYRIETYRFYGLTPGQTRRIERQIERR